MRGVKRTTSTSGDLQRNFVEEITKTGVTSEGMMEAVASSLNIPVEDRKHRCVGVRLIWGWH